MKSPKGPGASQKSSDRAAKSGIRKKIPTPTESEIASERNSTHPPNSFCSPSVWSSTAIFAERLRTFIPSTSVSANTTTPRSSGIRRSIPV